MASRINRNNLGGDTFSGIVSSDKFIEYTPEIQTKILEGLENRNQKEGGFMGKLFGNNKDLASINTATFICTILLFICALDVIQSFFKGHQIHMDLITCIIPVVSLELGFIFGKVREKEE